MIPSVDGDDPRGFTITFVFKENPYFSNDELTKKYHYGEGKEFLKETQIVEIESDAIQWKPGMVGPRVLDSKRERRRFRMLQWRP